MKWSDNQETIFNAVQKFNSNIIIEAVAGSGKTTTAVEAARRFTQQYPYHSVIFLAFNKSIAEEIKKRGLNGRTFHSLCCNAAKKSIRAYNVRADKVSNLITQNYDDDTCYIYRSYVTRLVSLGKQSGITCLIEDSQDNWLEIIDHHGLEFDRDGGDPHVAVEMASNVLQNLNDDSEFIDFDDMLYLPVKYDMPLPTASLVIVDEAQDTNALQRALIRKMLGANSKLVAIGDPAQAIYGFRGAGTNSMELIAHEFKCQRLPLSISYRCSKAVVKYSHQWVAHIQAAENAPEGEVRSLGKNFDAGEFEPGHLVVCRTNAPLIVQVFKAIKSCKSVTVMGNDIGKGLVTLVRKFKTNNLNALIVKIDNWATREIDLAMGREDMAKVATIYDKQACLRLFVEYAMEKQGDMQTVVQEIEYVFRDKANAVIFSSIHRAKGLEADVVWWLDYTKCPSKYAVKKWEKKQEYNLCYVATTRAKKTLNLIESEE